MIRVKQATKQGWIEMCNGGVADFSYPESKYRRGRVQGGGMISPTITTTSQLYQVYDMNEVMYGDRDKDCGYSLHDYSNCLPVNPMSDRGQMLMSKENENGRYRIRKLMPCECAKLMGLTKEDDDKMADIGISNSARYKAYGNGIVTNCIELLFEHLYKAQYDPEFECFDENFTSAVTV